MSVINLRPLQVDAYKTTWRGKTLNKLNKAELLQALVETASALQDERDNLAKSSRLLEFYLTNAKEGSLIELEEPNIEEYLRQYGFTDQSPLPGE